jgi:hypothetical protein
MVVDVACLFAVGIVAIAGADLEFRYVALYDYDWSGRRTCLFERSARSTNASMAASGTTYNVPRTLTFANRYANTTHINPTCKLRHIVQDNQNNHDFHLFRNQQVVGPNATAVHMIAACHLCGMPSRPKMIAAARTSPVPIHKTAPSLTIVCFFIVCVSFHQTVDIANPACGQL